jgi:hypothetical protein
MCHYLFIFIFEAQGWSLAPVDALPMDPKIFKE